MGSKRSRARLAIGFASGLIAAIIGLAGFFDSLEWKSWDWRLRHFGDSSRTTDDVALLLIDQNSLDFMEEQEGLPWPWPRSLYAPVIEYCRLAGAQAIVFDILFTEHSVYGVEDDAELAGVIAAGGDVVLAETGSAHPIEVLAQSARAIGNAGFQPDDDGIFRTIDPAGETGTLTLPFAVLRDVLGVSVDRAVGGDRAFSLGGAPVPLDKQGRFVIDYMGPAGTIPSYSMAAAIQSYVRQGTGEEIALPPERLAGRVVFLGMSAPGLLDLRPTPFSSVYPGAEVHATTMQNLLTRRFIRIAPLWITFLRSLGPAILLAFLLGRIRSAWKGAVLLPVFGALLIIGAVVAYRIGFWVPFVSPLFAILLAFVSVQTMEYATEGRQRRFLKHAFRHYLSPQVIEEIVQDPSRLKLGGERKELSIFFSDVASFTSLSERLEPEELTALLNRYLTEMTDVIQSEGGTVDKYEGDAIIAFWNAPIDQPNHAERALRAAVRCQLKLTEINPELAKSAGAPLSARIGVHTGQVIVGNMGSRDRFDYTVIGDAANLASRLEGLGKVFRSPIVVSEATWKAGEAAVNAREIGQVRVVGRAEPTRVFQPTALRGGSALFPWLSSVEGTFAEGLALYYQGDLLRAGERFASIPEDPVAGAYRDRCDELGSAVTTDGWDGVWEMTSK